MPATVLIPGQWYNANIDPLSFWRARLIVEQSSQNYEMNLTFVGTTSEMGIGEKVCVANSNSVYVEGIISNRIVFEHDYFLLIIVECCNIWKTKGAPDNYKLRLGSYHTRRWKHQNCFKGNTQCRISGFQKILQIYQIMTNSNCNSLIYLTSIILLFPEVCRRFNVK